VLPQAVKLFGGQRETRGEERREGMFGKGRKG